MDLTKFAPSPFKQHLQVLENIAKFNQTRLNCQLGCSKTRQHYVITGNDGSGRDEVVQKIYERMIDVIGSISIITIDVISVFDNNEGFTKAFSRLRSQ